MGGSTFCSNGFAVLWFIPMFPLQRSSRRPPHVIRLTSDHPAPSSPSDSTIRTLVDVDHEPAAVSPETALATRRTTDAPLDITGHTVPRKYRGKNVRRRKLTTQAQQALFLETYVDEGSILDACRRLRLNRATVYLWMANDPEFAAAVEEAKKAAIERLRGEAHKRALRKSDTMLMF